ncbi:sensor histidine kinase [Paenibacillus qinlingensis]|uniref:sensor histidine kinase n=1 Tax=Paenibacillus qinlingensis TaxID=1837343 RepID=UPI0015679C91|nr:sensor histidine kinase [Paenibacillus qinlingensis]
MKNKVFVKSYRNYGIATKQFLLLFVLTVTIFMTISWNNIGISKKSFENKMIEDSKLTVLRTNTFLNMYLENITNILLPISAQKDLIENGTTDESQNILQHYGEMNSHLIKTLYLVRSDGMVWSSKQVLYEIYGNQMLPKLNEMGSQGVEGLRWSEPYETALSDRTVAFIFPIRSKTNKYLGSAIAEISLEYLNQKIIPMISSSEQSIILSSLANEPIVFDPQSELLPYEKGVFPPVITSDFMKGIGQLIDGVDSTELGTQHYIVANSKGNNLGWRVSLLTNEKILNENVSKLYNNFAFTALLWIIVFLIGSFLISYYFTNPIRKLVLIMNTVTKYGRLSTIEMKREDEIGQLAMSYNSMMDRINGLIREIREVEVQKQAYELKMLQSQIGPHFLYNTLAGIGSLAKQGRNTEVRDTIRSLVNLLSYSFDKRYEYIALEEEIEALNSYIYIQKTRYGDIFTCHFDISPELMRCKVLKLTLQPIVENAIFHGLLSKKSSGRIEIRGRLVKNTMRIYVIDNGVGMEKEQYSKLLISSSERKLRDGFNSIGIMNVHERIQIYFGNQYGLHIVSRIHRGTIVRIDLPIMNDDHEVEMSGIRNR